MILQICLFKYVDKCFFDVSAIVWAVVVPMSATMLITMRLEKNTLRLPSRYKYARVYEPPRQDTRT